VIGSARYSLRERPLEPKLEPLMSDPSDPPRVEPTEPPELTPLPPPESRVVSVPVEVPPPLLAWDVPVLLPPALLPPPPPPPPLLVAVPLQLLLPPDEPCDWAEAGTLKSHIGTSRASA
jgi:hypothetical protein